MRALIVSIDRLRELFVLDDATGVLRWKVCPGSQVKIGDVAGGLSPDGYLRVGFDRKKIGAHRVVFALANGYMPEQVDHINGARADNRPCNLRAANASQNQMNKGLRSGTSSGAKGVTWHAQSKRWQAQVVANGRLKYLGLFVEKDDADRVARQFRAEHHGEFARHE